MGNRIIVCGSVHLSAGAYAKAQDTPLLEMFVADPNDPDGVSFVPKGMTAEEIFATDVGDDEYRAWARNTYERATERWIFGCSMHDDDWWNAKHDLLPGGLATVKDRPGLDVVLAYDDGARRLESAWKVERGSWTSVEPLPKLAHTFARLMADGKYEDALDEVRALVAQGP